MKRTYFIYKLTSPNGKVYIGQTYNINRRFSVYRTLMCSTQPKLFNSIKKHGWDNFRKEILFDYVCAKEIIDGIEESEISKYIKKGSSLNISEKVNSPTYLTGSNHPKSKKVLQFNLELKLLKEWVNASEASKRLNINQSCISKACRTSNFYSGGFYWRFKTDYSYEKLLKLLSRPHRLSQPIIQLSKKDVFIKEWDSQSEASTNLNINQGNIWRVLCGKGITAGGFKWIRKTT